MTFWVSLRWCLALPLFALAFSALGDDSQPFPTPPGVLTTKVMTLVEKSVTKGWTPEQVTLLAGKPEFIKKFAADTEVWRYRTATEFLLIAFREGTVAEVGRRPIPESSLRDVAQGAIDDTATANAPLDRASHPAATWSTFFDGVGRALGVEIGMARDTALTALQRSGFSPAAVSCNFDSRTTTEYCSVDSDAEAWHSAVPQVNATEKMFVLTIKDRRVVGSMLILEWKSQDACLNTTADIRATFAHLYGKAGQSLGSVRRRAGSMLLPGVAVADQAEWTDDKTRSGVVHGTRGSGAEKANVVFAVIMEK